TGDEPGRQLSRRTADWTDRAESLERSQADIWNSPTPALRPSFFSLKASGLFAEKLPELSWGAGAVAQGQWGDTEALDQSAAGVKGSAHGGDLKASPGSARWKSRGAGHPKGRTRHVACTRVYGAERKNSLGLNGVPSSQSVQRVRRILRWVLSRACVLDAVRGRLAR